MDIHPKVLAGGSTATLSGALSVLIIWLCTARGIQIPAEAAAAIATIVCALCGTVAGYFTPSTKGS